MQKSFLTYANLLTAIRILIAPIFFFYIIQSDAISTRIAGALFTFAALTDYIDGLVARAFGEVSDMGMFLDPLADKVLVLSALLAFVYLEHISLWMVLVITLRDALMTILRTYAESKNMILQTSSSAKFKTFLQMLFIFVILIAKIILGAPIFESLYIYANIVLYGPGLIIGMIILMTITVWTLVEYILDNRILFKKNNT